MNSCKYLSLKRVAEVLGDNADYDLYKAEMNPIIFESLIEETLDRNLPPKIWEPFAGHTGVSKTQNIALEENVELLSWDLKPSDLRVKKMDAVRHCPSETPVFGSVLFHPPYFGSVNLSGCEEDLGVERTEEGYKEKLRLVIQTIKKVLVKKGIVCAVARDYRFDGKRIRLDQWFVDLFEAEGFNMDLVWLSEPDVAIIFQRR